MHINEQTAVIDNDFINHLVESGLDDERLVVNLRTAFSELKLSAVMHPLVYEKELLKGNSRIDKLFSMSVVEKAEFEDIFQGDSGRKAYYLFLVKNLYRSLMGEPLPVSDEKILSYWVRKHSLGEVHSVSMCLVCGCAVFLSDDGDSKALKRIVENQTMGKIEVYNRQEFFDKHLSEGETRIERKERRSLTHSVSRT